MPERRFREAPPAALGSSKPPLSSIGHVHGKEGIHPAQTAAFPLWNTEQAPDLAQSKGFMINGTSSNKPGIVHGIFQVSRALAAE